MLRQAVTTLSILAPARGLHDITRPVRAWLAGEAFTDGLLTIFCRHTSASLLIQENAAPAARRDLERFFAVLAPEGDGYEHHDEGPDDMPAHLRSALTASHLSILLIDGDLMLGTWQGIYLFEHRSRPTPRTLALHLGGQ